MRIMSTLMVTSTTSTTSSTIPTAEKSPDPSTDWDDLAHLVYPDGDIYGDGSDVYNSYGHLFDRLFQNSINYWWLRSPRTSGIGYIAWFVTLSGVVYHGNLGDSVSTDSYGRLSPDSFMYYNYTSFYVMEDGSMITYAVEYSYGKLFKYL